MIKVAMFSQAETVSGQGVGSAYLELIKALKKYDSDSLTITINSYAKSDISHYHTVNPTYYLSTFFRKRRGVMAGYVHFLPETLEGSLHLPRLFMKIFDKYLISFYKRMDHLIVVNPDFINKLVALGIKKEKITFIPNFVSSDEFFELSSDEKRKFREKIGVAQDKFTIFGVGQIQKRKGLDDFIALAKANPDLQFIWAGGFSFGKITDGYEEYKKVYDNPPKNLMFTGIIDRSDLTNYYNIADLFLLPSYNELFPMSILEALNCNTPIMLRDLELYESILGDSYIKAKDYTEMDKLIKHYSTHPKELQEILDLAQKSRAKYSEQNLAKTWEDYYKSILRD